jgi:hypothetical protein
MTAKAGRAVFICGSGDLRQFATFDQYTVRYRRLGKSARRQVSASPIRPLNRRMTNGSNIIVAEGPTKPSSRRAATTPRSRRGRRDILVGSGPAHGERTQPSRRDHRFSNTPITT